MISMNITIEMSCLTASKKSKYVNLIIDINNKVKGKAVGMIGEN